MGLFDFGQHDSYQQYQQYSQNPEEHKAKFSHELIAGAAAFEAEKAYERHCEQNGKPESHEKAKELLAGFAGAFIDREFETKGLDFMDREKAKRHAQDQMFQQVGPSNY